MLNRQIRGNAEIKSLRIRGKEFKLQVYADDLAMILEKPLDSLEELVRTIEEFRAVVGLKIKYQKKFMTKR